MSDTIKKLREKLVQKQEELKVEQEITEKVTELNQVTYDAIPDPDGNGRNFVMVKIKYDLKSRQAVVEEVRPLRAKPVGFKTVDNKKDLEYIFNKCKKE